ncbi:unnamed protein product [Rotaria magnacalcarata]|uniref:Uncharacterized protein n=1 Tax=Rotaria magnacalcarata TaxID=392030 RepID=A0A816XJM1_9BILA|nr:unnamed protein product [Rotaria magnacalcarata]CAF4070737.1 unnamed protein product [Rotaria magnacalcarata]
MNDPQRISFQLLNSSFKIPKIKRTETKAKTNYPDIIITQTEMFRIFHNLTILFVGDSSIRTLFRDFTKFFSKNRLLENTEAQSQHGEYKLVEGETRLKTGGSRGTPEYKDIRQYECQSSSTRLIYIHLPTIFGESPIDLT